MCAVVLRVCCNYRSPEAEESEGHSCLVGLYRGLPMSREDEIVAGHPFEIFETRLQILTCWACHHIRDNGLVA